MQRFEIEKFTGIDLTSVEGVAQTSPVELEFVAFDRRGGYAFSGGVQSSSITGDSLPFGLDFIAYDQDGFAGAADTGTPDTLYLLRDFSGSEVSASVSGGAYAFVGKVGVVGHAASNDTIVGGTTRDAAFYVSVQDGTYINGSDVVTSGNPVEITSASFPSVSTGGITTTVDTYLGFAAAPFLKTEAGKLIAGWASSPMFEHSTNSRAEANYAVSQSSPNASASLDVFFIDRARGSYTHIEQADSTNTSGTVETYPFGLTYSFPVAAAYSGHAVLHNRRVYGVPSPNSDRYSSPRETDETANLLASLGNSAVIYSSFGYVNLVENDSWFTVPFNISDGVTALTSSPGGLLIFGERETFLARSDPALQDFQVQRLSGLTGHDGEYPPATVGGTVFCVSDGDIYAISLGMGDVDFGQGIQKIGAPLEGVHDFTGVIAEPANRALIAHTALDEDTRLFRLDLDTQQWSNDPLDPQSGSTILPIPYYGDDGYGILFVGDTYEQPFGGTPDAAGLNVRWEDLDLGDKNLKKLWRRVRIYANNSYPNALSPDMTWNISGSSGTVSATHEGGSRFVFTLPAGLVGEKATFTIRLWGADPGDTLEPPVVVEAAPRYRQR